MSRPIWLFIDGAENFGGHEVMLLRWLQELHAQQQVDRVLMARAGGRLLERGQSIASLASLRSSPCHTFWQRFMRGCHDVWTLLRVVRRVQPDLLIIAEGCLLAQWPFTLMAWLLRQRILIYVPLVDSATDMGYGSGRLRDFLVRHVYRHLPDAWLTLTPELATRLVEWSGIRQRVLWLSNALAPEIEAAGYVPRAASTPLQVLVLGRLDAHHKGLDVLLAHLRTHSELAAELHFSFVGEGPFAQQINATLRADPALHSLISLKPWSISLTVLPKADVLLLASRYEGVPLVVLEAMALGVPVISTDLPGVRHLLPDSCRFTVGDIASAIDLLRQTARPESRLALIERNRHVVMRHASAAVFTDAVQLLTAALSVYRRSRPIRHGAAQPVLELLQPRPEQNNERVTRDGA